MDMICRGLGDQKSKWLEGASNETRRETLFIRLAGRAYVCSISIVFAIQMFFFQPQSSLEFARDPIVLTAIRHLAQTPAGAFITDARFKTLVLRDGVDEVAVQLWGDSVKIEIARLELAVLEYNLLEPVVGADEKKTKFRLCRSKVRPSVNVIKQRMSFIMIGKHSRRLCTYVCFV